MTWPALAAARPELAHIPAALRDAARVRALAAGETVFRQGDRPKAMFCVLDGEVRLLRRSREGGEVILQRSRGGFFAEASLESKAYHCDAEATAAGRLLAFPLRAFREALEGDAAFSNAWMAQLAREVRKLRARCERLSLHGAEARILHAIESEGTAGTLALARSRKAWAAELGLTHEALYRALARLQAAGTLSLDGERLTLRQPRKRL
ncbi:MAG: Crp/Fnr family transcriptional regulator [Rhodocyclales bacterium]|nr:Crp/Fnr family transcriptional regulator [Rhodocyclales bacterium]